MYNLIFDCDGVLVDSEHLSCATWLPVLARHGVEAEIAEIETMIGKSDRAVLAHFSAKTGIDFPPEVLAERRGADPQCCAVVDDSVFGIEAARRAGMRAIGFTSRHQAADLHTAGADATFAHYADFPALYAAL